MTAFSCPKNRILWMPWSFSPGMKQKFFIAVILAISTFIIRFPNIGDPNYHVDEGFYLFVGKAMHLGALPYVDIWDRKPLGIFLIYAAIASLGGDGLVQYQIIAALFVYLTAFTLSLISQRVSNTIGGILAGLTYIATLETLAGGGGQTPIFYNLFMVLAFFLLLRAWDSKTTKGLHLPSVLSMALCGCAIFVKQTAFVESCFFGAVLIWLYWKRGKSLSYLIMLCIIFIIFGLLPTASGFLSYVALGHGSEYYFANFTSIFLKHGAPWLERLGKAIYLAIRIMPLLALTFFGLRLLPWKDGERRRKDSYLICCWLVGALGGFLIVPNFYDHYALPLIAPMAVAASPIFARRGVGMLYAVLPIAWALGIAGYPAFARVDRSRAGMESISSLIKNNLNGGCLYIFDGPPILYDLTRSCLPTTHAFSEHMNFEAESDATGMDTTQEMRRILKSRPSVIVKATKIIVSEPNWQTRRMVDAELIRHYKLRGVIRVEDFAIPRNLEVWVRNQPYGDDIAGSPHLISHL